MLNQLDTDLLIWVNSHHNNVLDMMMWWISDRFFWIPFYAWLAVMVIKLYPQNWWKVFICIAIMILITDQSANFLKEHFERLRPCHTPQLQTVIHLVNGYCGGNFGYASSHASNSVGLATFCIILFRKRYQWLKYTLIFYAALICYSRVYLGAHFPFDILRGALIGIIAGYLVALFTLRFISKPSATI